MDPDSCWLRILWVWPELPKRKAKRFLRLGDYYREKGRSDLASFCYNRSLQLARSVRAVHLQKKIEERVFS